MSFCTICGEMLPCGCGWNWSGPAAYEKTALVLDAHAEGWIDTAIAADVLAEALDCTVLMAAQLLAGLARIQMREAIQARDENGTWTT